MKLLQKATYAIVFAFIYTFSVPCEGQKKGTFTTVFEAQLPFKVKPISFQEWYAGIKVGGTGINIFVPLTDIAENVEIDRVYFRNLSGILNQKDGKFFATLKSESRRYTFKKSEAPADFPFTLKDDECVVSYIEEGVTKYLKIAAVTEFAGIYYENGPPSIYTDRSDTDIATLDSDDDDD
ncbi:MAG: hypothetical protein AB8B52_13960 [Winogradskyella sp.]|uniref:hypothetical protein n=1 Tax=Winogradskyella sp. TaxID=1883156 RepID=UPI00385EC56B